MYSAQISKDRIKLMRHRHNKIISEKELLSNCSLGENAIRQMSDKKGMSSISLALIADYLDCSVDYLLGRTDNPNSHKNQSSNSVNGNYNAVDNSSVTVNTATLNSHQQALLDIYNALDPVCQAQLLIKANEFKNE